MNTWDELEGMVVKVSAIPEDERKNLAKLKDIIKRFMPTYKRIMKAYASGKVPGKRALQRMIAQHESFESESISIDRPYEEHPEVAKQFQYLEGIIDKAGVAIGKLQKKRGFKQKYTKEQGDKMVDDFLDRFSFRDDDE